MNEWLAYLSPVDPTININILICEFGIYSEGKGVAEIVN